jgi:hypothetical protein
VNRPRCLLVLDHREAFPNPSERAGCSWQADFGIDASRTRWMSGWEIAFMVTDGFVILFSILV